MRYLSIIWVLWMVFLVIMLFVSDLNPRFFDAVTQTDVSEHYNVSVPFMRYALEPVVMFVFILGFSNVGWVVLYIPTIIIVTIAYKVLDKNHYENRLSEHPFLRILQDTLHFFLKIFVITMIIVLIYLGVLLFRFGFVYVVNRFLVALQIAILSNLVLYAGKLILNLYRFFKTSWAPAPFVAKLSHRPKIHARLTRTIVFFSLLLLILSLNFAASMIVLPTYRYEADLAPNEILVDFHSHTTLSDGTLTPEQRVDWYIQQGIHAAAISDHFHAEGSRRAQEYVDKHGLDFIVIEAQEYTQYVPYLHMNLFGVEEPITPPDQSGPYAPNQMTIPEAIEYTHSLGGYVIVAHYVPPERAPYSYEQLRDWGVDGFEIATFADERAPEIREFCIENELIMVSGTDEHQNQEARLFTKVTLLDPANVTVSGIFESMRAHQPEVVVVELYGDVIRWPLRDTFDVINYFVGISAGQIASWLLWSVGVYTGFLLTFRVIKKRSEYFD